jgi:hypothetical protein
MNTCNHNEMIETGDKTFVWKCAKCGFIYGLTGKKHIRVIKTKNGYVKRHEYSQGYSSFSSTNDPLKAFDLNGTEYNPAFTEKCLFGPNHVDDSPVIEEYELTITRIV